MDAPRAAASPFDEAFRADARAHAARYGGPDDQRAMLEVALTVSLFLAGMTAFPHAFRLASDLVHRVAGGDYSARTVARLAASTALATAIASVQSATFIRAFLLHHDLMHGTLFSTRRARLAAALAVGTIACTSPSVWKREHDRHHRDSNNLDAEQDGQTASWTVARYLASPRWQRRVYHLLNVPFTLFTVLPLAYFFGFMRVKGRWYENALVVALLVVLWQAGRLGYFFATFAVAASAGFYLFHLQHTFPGVYKRRAAEWDAFDNAILGSSFIALPNGPVVGRVLRWFSYGVECHDAHHLNPRIPGYRLARCHADGERFFSPRSRVTLLGGLGTVRASLYDEERRVLASVGDLPF